MTLKEKKSELYHILNGYHGAFKPKHKVKYEQVGIYTDGAFLYVHGERFN